MAKKTDNYAYDYIVAVTTDNKRITLNGKHIVGYMEHTDNDLRTLTVYTTGGFTFECLDDHEDYPYELLCIAIDECITHTH